MLSDDPSLAAITLADDGLPGHNWYGCAEQMNRGDIMNLNTADLKKLVYSSMLSLGIVCLAISLILYSKITPDPDNISNYLTSFVLFFAGCGCTLFGVEAFYLNDEDIWR